MNIDRIHLRVIMMYEFRRGTRISNTVKNICNVFGENAVSIPTCERWFAKFKRGDFNLEDQPRSGRPSGIDDDIVRNLVDTNSRISTQEIAEKLNVDRSTAFRHLKKLGYSLKLDVWVPHNLTERNKMDRVSTANSLLGRLKTDPFLDRLVTGDEIWIQYDNAERKRTWRQKNECGQAKAGLQPQKAKLSVWWDCKGVIFYELLRVGETITSDKYCQQLDNLKTAIEEKRPVLAKQKDVVFHHNNARSHISMQTQRKLGELNWDLLLHPPYSPDISPSDYYLFRSLQNSLNGRKFTSFNDLQNYISSFFDEKPATFYDRGIRMLSERWRKIIENDGDYLIE